jgi:hypothetical protein
MGTKEEGKRDRKKKVRKEVTKRRMGGYTK